MKLINSEIKTSLESAQAAGLVLIEPGAPGYRRTKLNGQWRYIDLRGQHILREATIKRINSLGIPPAWENVWICPDVNGHIQATGTDVRGRKQYRYHPRWRAERDTEKFSQMLAFAKNLPRVRAALRNDIRAKGLPKRKVLATIVMLLQSTLIRVGNEEYKRANDSFGLSTMLKRHVSIRGAKIRFTFYGKSGKYHDITIRDAKLAKIVAKIKNLRGRDLFQYTDEHGRRNTLTSADVNEYLRSISGFECSAKDFRTWAGTVLAVRSLSSAPAADSERKRKKNLIAAFDYVCARLGNTRAVCRKSYIHPAVISSYMDESFQALLPSKARKFAGTKENVANALEESIVISLLMKLTRSHEQSSDAKAAS